MALVLADRVREQSTTSGTGTFSLSGAVTGYQTFSSAIGNGNTCYYTISNPGTTEWEVGIGTVSAGQLARTTILSSSNAGSAVNFSSGTKDVFVTYPSQKAVYLDASGNLTPGALTLTSLVVSGTTNLNGGTTIGDASGDALTINSSAVSIPNGLNFDSNTLVIDATNNRVGVGTASPAESLDISGNLKMPAASYVDIGSAGGLNSLTLGKTSTSTGNISRQFIISSRYSSSDVTLTLTAGNNTLDSTVGASSSLLFATGGSTERMRITSTGNVGIGTSSPAGKLVVSNGSSGTTVNAQADDFIVDSSSDVGISILSPDANVSRLVFGSPSDSLAAQVNWDYTNKSLYVGTATATGKLLLITGNAATAATLDSTGNLGLGVTPSAWSLSGLQAMQIKNAGVHGYLNEAGVEVNAYYSGSWRYISDGYASQHLQVSGQHRWLTAPSGTAGNAITFTQAMTLDSAGKLLIGATATRSGLAYMQTIESGNTAGNIIVRNSADTGGSISILAKSRGTTAGSVTAVSSGDTLGSYIFYGADGTGLIQAASISGAVDGTPGTNDMPGRLVFSTTADGASFPTERMRLDSSGNLGLGVTPSAWRSTERVLQLPDGAFYTGSNYVAMGQNYYIPTGGGSIYIESDEASDYYQLNGTHVWRTAASGTAGNAITWTQAMTLDASGRLLLGNTSSITSSLGSANMQISGATQGAGSTQNLVFNTSASGPVLELGLSKNATVGSQTIVASGNNLGSIRFSGSDGTAFIRAAQIAGEVDGTPGTNDMPGRLVFLTTADGASSPTERMRIDSSGNVLFAKAVRATITTDNDLSFDMNAASNFKCTPTAGGALTFTNITSGQTGNIILVNGSNYAITAAATTKVSSTCLATISATGTYWLSYISDGTNVYVANTGALA